MTRRLIYTLLFLLLPLASLATHNRSGSITYVHLYGTTYEFTVTTCTRLEAEADRPELEIRWGDGTSDTLSRIDIDSIPLYDVQKNIYKGTHTYTGPDSYIIEIEDPNRNIDVLNITNSVDKIFCIQTELVISPFIGAPNNSLIIEDCPCPEFACVNELYCYNLSAYDPDGDSLSYSLVPCLGEDCLEMSIPAIYRYPDDVGGGILSIDSITGTMCWEVPSLLGTYNIAIKISEYRNGFYIGSVLLDMQFDVMQCDDITNPPILEEINDTCIYAGTPLNLSISASDDVENVRVYATGAIFNFADNPAIFAEDIGSPTATGSFYWLPDCSQASNSYYTVTTHAEDFHPAIQLSAVSDFRIKVNIPPVENVTLTPLGNTMSLNWDNSVCDNIVGYNIYRSTDSSTYTDDCCDQGATAAMGYTLIGNSITTEYIDASPLVVGTQYCYLVTAVNSNGVESCVSLQVCDALKFEVPLITNVSIMSTAIITGTDSVYWSYPKELNTALFPSPYRYQLYRQENLGVGTPLLVYTSADQATISNPDTSFFDTNLNTTNLGYTYYVELYSNNALVGASITGSSIFITLTPNDNELAINWTENTPWTNTIYEVYRENSTSGSFDLIGTTTSIGYLDTGLVNGRNYCYKIKSIGGFSADGIRSPIENWSQEACGIPIDLTPPCPPTLRINGSCDLEETYLNWTNPNKSCADDVTRYNLYFAPFENDSLELLITIDSDLDTFYTHKDRGSIAGCYYVTAIDSIQYNNESSPSNIVCIDNCSGYYELPNIFSPNKDGFNDLYHPLLPFKFVESVDFRVQNRWGQIVFQTNDPFIYWDGVNQTTGEPCPDGVYFYTILVNEIKLSGLTPRSFHGNIQLLNGVD